MNGKTGIDRIKRGPEHAADEASSSKAQNGCSRGGIRGGTRRYWRLRAQSR